MTTLNKKTIYIEPRKCIMKGSLNANAYFDPVIKKKYYRLADLPIKVSSELIKLRESGVMNLWDTEIKYTGEDLGCCIGQRNLVRYLRANQHLGYYPFTIYDFGSKCDDIINGNLN